MALLRALAARESLVGHFRASNTLEVHDGVVPKNLLLVHDVKVVLNTERVRLSRCSTPFLVTFLGIKFGHHDDHGLALGNSLAFVRRSLACGGKLVAFSATRTTPGALAE